MSWYAHQTFGLNQKKKENKNSPIIASGEILDLKRKVGSSANEAPEQRILTVWSCDGFVLDGLLRNQTAGDCVAGYSLLT